MKQTLLSYVLQPRAFYSLEYTGARQIKYHLQGHSILTRSEIVAELTDLKILDLPRDHQLFYTIQWPAFCLCSYVISNCGNLWQE